MIGCMLVSSVGRQAAGDPEVADCEHKLAVMESTLGFYLNMKHPRPKPSYCWNINAAFVFLLFVCHSEMYYCYACRIRLRDQNVIVDLIRKSLCLKVYQHVFLPL